MSGITALTAEAVAAFVAVFKSVRHQNVKIGGNHPASPPLAEKLADFGFYEHVQSSKSSPAKRGAMRIGGNEHLVRQSEKVRATNAAEMVDFARKIFPETLHKGVFTMFMEATTNTVEHASNTGQPTRWVAGAYFDEERKVISFTVIDRGVGILNSVKFNPIFMHSGGVSRGTPERSSVRCSSVTCDHKLNNLIAASGYPARFARSKRGASETWRSLLTADSLMWARNDLWNLTSRLTVQSYIGRQAMATISQIKILIKDDYTNLPGPRFRHQGPHSGEDFREAILEPKFTEAERNGDTLFIDLDGGYGYGTSFLEEAFGGLARNHGIRRVLDILELKSDEEPYLIDDIKRYIRDCNGRTGKTGR